MPQQDKTEKTMPQLHITNTAHSILTSLSEDHVVSGCPDNGGWTVPVSQETYNMLNGAREEGETMSEVIIRVYGGRVDGGRM